MSGPSDQSSQGVRSDALRQALGQRAASLLVQKSPDRRSRARRFRRGAALLEVVISLSLLLVAMSVVGLIFRNGQRNVELAERLTRAMLMTDRLLVELDTSILDWEEREESGWFGDESIPGLSWRMEINPHERIGDLLEVDVHIYLGDPDGPEEERKRILTTHVLRAKPQGIDFEKDFGLDEEQIDQLTEVIPGGETVFDPTDFDPRELAQLDLDTLMELLPEIMPALMQVFGGNLAGQDLDALLQAAQGADAGALEELAEQASAAAGADAGGDKADTGMGAGAEENPDRPRRGRRGGGTRRGIGDRRGGGGR